MDSSLLFALAAFGDLIHLSAVIGFTTALEPFIPVAGVLVATVVGAAQVWVANRGPRHDRSVIRHGITRVLRLTCPDGVTLTVSGRSLTDVYVVDFIIMVMGRRDIGPDRFHENRPLMIIFDRLPVDLLPPLPRVRHELRERTLSVGPTLLRAGDEHRFRIAFDGDSPAPEFNHEDAPSNTDMVRLRYRPGVVGRLLSLSSIVSYIVALTLALPGALLATVDVTRLTGLILLSVALTPAAVGLTTTFTRR